MALLTFRKLQEGKIEKARQDHGPYHSAHEAYAVILEELDEFWEEVRMRSENRDHGVMLRELVDIAVTAERAAYDLGLIDEKP
jgi:hypothetical protein